MSPLPDPEPDPEREPQTGAVLAALERSGILEPLSESAEDVRLWRDHDLASFVENRLGFELDPRQMDAAQRPAWIARATSESEGLGTPHSPYHKAYCMRIPCLAPGTFSVALAVNGFPLITSEDAWRAQLRRGFSDIGGPEGLAFKIRRFEAWDRKQGWLTPASRIPGLDYPDWDAVE